MAAANPHRDRTLFIWAVIASLVVHVFMVLGFVGMAEPVFTEPLLCEGMRCPEPVFFPLRYGIDESALMDLEIIDAAVIPMLGLAEKQRYFPKLVKYEQPEEQEEAVAQATPKPAPTPAERPKKAEVDKKNPLAQILGAPRDDDPRKRPTALDKIVGSPDGSVYGHGTDAKAGNVYASKVALAIRQQFTVPPFVSQGELGNLRVRIKVGKMDDKGRILAFTIVEKSANQGFNAAALQAIQQFVAAEGGGQRLPIPDAATLAYINKRGMMIDLDGSLFRR